MRRVVTWLLIVIALALARSRAEAGDIEARVQDFLNRRYQLSEIELEDPSQQGSVTRVGKLLTLSADGVPAKPLRVVRTKGMPHAMHVMEFAQVNIRADGNVDAASGPLRLPKGTLLVVLDAKLRGNQVHLLTHTAGPVAGEIGASPAVYGCTEFIFHLEPRVLETPPVEPTLQAIERTIERWLEWTPGERVCSPGIDRICLEP